MAEGNQRFGVQQVERVGLTAEAVSRCKKERSKALLRHQVGDAGTTRSRMIERIVQVRRGQWTTRLLAKRVGLTSGCVSDVPPKNNELKPHGERSG